MATYAQWLKANKTPKLLWVCGSDRVLVEAVVEEFRRKVTSADVDRVHLVAGTDPDKDVWAALNQYTTDPSAKRLIVVRAAQNIQSWDPFMRWAQESRRMPNTYFCCVSDDEDFAAHTVGESRVLDEQIAMMKARGSIVRCQGTEAELTAYVEKHIRIGKQAMRVLMLRSGFDTSAIKDVVAKIKVLDLRADEELIRQLCSENGEMDVLEKMVYRHKEEALWSAQRIGREEASRVIGAASTVLDYMEHLYPAAVNGAPMWEVVSKGLVPDFPARKWWAAAKFYDPLSRDRARAALVIADHGAAVGGEGSLEALIGMW